MAHTQTQTVPPQPLYLNPSGSNPASPVWIAAARSLPEHTRRRSFAPAPQPPALPVVPAARPNQVRVCPTSLGQVRVAEIAGLVHLRPAVQSLRLVAARSRAWLRSKYRVRERARARLFSGTVGPCVQTVAATS